MSRWWRAYDEAVDDPKLQRLGPKLGWAWFNLMCITSANGGALPPIGDVAFKLRITEQQAAATIAALVSAGLFEKRDDGHFAPHNWDGRQFKSDVSTGRVKRFRERERNVSTAVSETPPETETETETETDVSCPVGKPTRTRVGVAYSEEFETKFWQPYPRTPNMSKLEAWQVWAKLAPEDRLKACEAIEPYKRFLRTKPDLETVHACRFLSKRRFDGFSLTAVQNSQPDIRSSIV
jgi:hypothetical protein